jgi:hypothetical protein
LRFGASGGGFYPANAGAQGKDMKTIEVFTVRKSAKRRRKPALKITHAYRVVTKRGYMTFVHLHQATKFFNNFAGKALYQITLFGYAPIKRRRLV